MTPSPVRIYVPIDSAALSVGAHRVATAIAAEAARRGAAVEIIRNGTRGMLFLEPLVEVETAAGRFAYGPVSPRDVAGLFEAGFLAGGEHALGHGLTTEIPFFKNQERLTFARCGVIDPLSLDAYRAHGGLAGLERTLRMAQPDIIDEVIASGLRGRGGAGFPTGIKWKTVLSVASDQKYVTCNADEGDSGTFADRMIMEGDPFTLIEGMIIAGLAVGADKGFIYLRSEYPHAHRTLLKAIAIAEEEGLLGRSVLGSGKAFHLEVRLGAGSYVCGEESAMLESLEGKRGIVRAKPPIPAFKGLFGKPTAANNVISLATIPWIMANGGPAYAAFGMGRSLGTLTIQLAGNIARGGLIEKSLRRYFARGNRDLWWRHAFGQALPRRAGRRTAGGVFSGRSARYAAGLRGDGKGRRPARPWRHGCLRRNRRSCTPGAIRFRVLRQGKLRQVHALPDRRNARCRTHGQGARG